MKAVFAGLLLIALAAPASAISVDGTVDAEYGAALAVQQTQTGFGNASPPGSLGGSELDAGYATVEGGRLYLMITGNHEPNFNKLDIFIDSQAGGEHTLSATPDYDFSPDGGTFWISSNLAGLTFDTDFEADYHLFARWGGGAGTDPYEVDFIDRQGGVSAMVPGSGGASAAPAGLQATGMIAAGSVGTNASGASLSEDLYFAIDNNNAAGVGSDPSMPADMLAAAAVTTGMEFSISLADLGLAGATGGEEIKIFAAINNGDHNYLSNQLLGPLPGGTGNLGGDGGGGFTGDLGGVDLRQFDGLQYFSVTVPAIPEPSALILAAVSSLGLLWRRR